MKRLSFRIGDWCREMLKLSEEQYHIVLYGLEVMIGAVAKTVILLIAGVLFQCLPTVILMMLVFGIFRQLAGGFHSSTHMGCLGAMFVVCFNPVLCSRMDIRIAQLLWIQMLIYATYQFYKYAPRNSKVNPIYNEGILRRKRVGSLIANWAVIVFVLIFWNNSFCWIPVIALFAEAVMISGMVMDR